MKYAKMKKGIRNRWVKALRSGKYKQGQSRLATKTLGPCLKSIEEYCCLGVLCKIQDPGQAHWDGSESLPPDILSAGLDNKAMQKLVMMNDEDHRTFKGIATWIEKHL